MGSSVRSLLLSSIVAMICWTPTTVALVPTGATPGPHSHRGTEGTSSLSDVQQAQLQKYPTVVRSGTPNGGHLAAGAEGGAAAGGAPPLHGAHPRTPRMVTYPADAEEGVAPSSLVNDKPLTPHQMRVMLRAHDDAVSKARAAARERQQQRGKVPSADQRSTNSSDEASAIKRKTPATTSRRSVGAGDGLSQHGSRKRWIDLFGGSSVESRFPLPERRQFPEVDWRGFNEDVFHESFGDFSPVKRWRRRRAVNVRPAEERM